MYTLRCAERQEYVSTAGEITVTDGLVSAKLSPQLDQQIAS